LLKARNVDLKASPDLKMFSVPPWLMSFGMKLVVRFLPPLKQILTGHTNQEETRSYARDVIILAEKMKINLPRYEVNKELIFKNQ